MASAAKPQEVTRLLQAWSHGSEQAREELWALLYRELKTMARSTSQRQRGGRKHSDSSLVHLAYLRLLGSDVDWKDRDHFFAVACRAMRFVLIDEARRQMREKRRSEVKQEQGGGCELSEVVDPGRFRPEEVLAVHQVMGKLATINPRHERLVELRYFAGLSVTETAEILGITSRTVVRDWRSIRSWLHHQLQESV